MITLRRRPTTCRTNDSTPSTKFCPRCGGPSTWVRREAGPQSDGDSLARTACGRCAPALAAWLDEGRDPDAFVDVTLAAPWRAALDHFDGLADAAARDEVRSLVPTA